MKKMSFLFALMALICFRGFAQHKVHLLICYQPGHFYNERTDQITNMEMVITGNIDTLQTPGASKDPVKKTVMTHSEKETTTGGIYNDSLFQIKSVITKMQNMDGNSPIPPGSIIYSTGHKSGRVNVDSMSAEGMDPDLKEKMLPLLKSMMEQIIMPEHTLKMGESFTFQTPLKFPISGFTLNLAINTTYTLKSISAGIANLDMSQTYTMNSESVAIPITASGTGHGNMSYDIDNSYFTEYDANNTINMISNMGGRGMKMKIESSTTQKVAISGK